MNTEMLATTHQETPIWFDAGEHLLFGILTVPQGPPRGVGMIIVSGGGMPLSTNVNDLSVRLCRGISAHGFHGFRFDYHGVGESSGVLDQFQLAAPFVFDLTGAIRSLKERGIRRFVLVGSCFGARTVLAAAPDTDGLAGVVLICPPVRDFEMGERIATRLAAELSLWDYIRRAARPRTLTGLFHADSRRTYSRVAREKLRHAVRSESSHDRQARYAISPRFLEPLDSLAERGLPISIVFGDADDLFLEFERARAGALGKILKTEQNIDLTVIPGAVHGFTSVEVQDAVLDVITERLIRLEPDGPRGKPKRA